MALYLTRDRSDDGRGEVILWHVPDGECPPKLDEIGKWYHPNNEHQALFLSAEEIEKAPALKREGGIVRVFLTETEPRKKGTAWKEKESPSAVLASMPT